MSRCCLCTSSITAKKQSISCGGFCKKQFHLTCVGVPPEVPSLLKDTPGLFWKCNNCKEFHDIFDQDKLLNIFEDRIKSFFNEINVMFDGVKKEFLMKAEEKLSKLVVNSGDTTLDITTAKPDKPSYSSVLCNSSHPAVIVKPKNTQENKQTKSDILQNINVNRPDININKIKHIKDGGLVVSCQTTEEISKFKKIVEEKMSTNYDIREVRGLHPRVRIVGLSEKFNVDALENLIRKQNIEMFSVDSECKIMKIWATKNNKNVYQATLQLDMSTYNKVITNGYLLVGLDLCKIFDAIEILRCYNCNGFNHSKTACKKQLTCPNCGGSHDKDNCQSDVLRCINCTNLKETKKLDISVDHAAWDHANCHAYKNAVFKLKSDLGYQ